MWFAFENMEVLLLKTFMLGAGSSCDFGYPLGKDIFPKAKEMAYSKQVAAQSKKARHLFMAFEKVKFNMKQLFPGLPEDINKWPNFEELYSFIDRELSKPEDLRINGANEEFKRNLKTMLFFTISVCGFKPFLDEHELSDKYVTCIGNMLKDDQVNIISFNYDVLLPYALKENGVTPDYGYRCYDGDAEKADKILNIGDKKVNVVLPHGAVNLADCPRCKRRYFSIDPFTAKIRNLRAKCPKCKDSLTDDFLIPPSFNKYIENANDANRILNYISGASEIFVVGYSFPPYDYYTRLLFMLGLSNNPNNPIIHAIDIVDQATAEKMFAFIDPERYAVEFHLEGFVNFFYE